MFHFSRQLATPALQYHPLLLGLHVCILQSFPGFLNQPVVLLLSQLLPSSSTGSLPEVSPEPVLWGIRAALTRSPVCRLGSGTPTVALT